MRIYREINNNNLCNGNKFDIIWKHIYSTTDLSLDDLGLEDEIMYDEDREEYYPLTVLTLRALKYSVERINNLIEYWSQNPTQYRNADCVERMKKARKAFQKEVDEQDDNTYYLLEY